MIPLFILFFATLFDLLRHLRPTMKHNMQSAQMSAHRGATSVSLHLPEDALS